MDDRYPLIVCASLVQNPMNLGALCRTVEGFRLASLVLPSQAVIDDWEFRKLAVSAQQWQPLAVCAPASLPKWIQHQQHQGYTVHALTLSPQAEVLSKVIFPQRTVILLGRELTGIPMEIEKLCDRRVVIPQYGQVDSLNVATAGAIAMYEYMRQQVG
ncbi:MAG: RNA methyltransferase [Cyanobacteria bacterium P01_A01_bin.123]